MDGFSKNGFGRFFRDLFDVHAALGAGHDDWPSCLAVEKRGQVEFFEDVLRRGDEQCVHSPAALSGLFGDEDFSKHGFCFFLRFGGGLAKVNAASEAVFEDALPTPAGVDLRFDHKRAGADGEKPLGNGLCRRRGLARLSRRNRNSVRGKQLLCLKLVQVHYVYGNWEGGDGCVRRIAQRRLSFQAGNRTV